MRILIALIAGGVAALVGAGVWILVSHFTGYEVGIIAWGVGAVVGIAVYLGSGQTGGVALGLLAVVLAVAGVVGGKFGAVYVDVQDVMNSDDLYIAAVADELIYRQEKETGQRIPRPYVDEDTAESIEEFYPSRAWQQARLQWHQMPEAEKQQIREVPALTNADLHLMYLADEIVAEREEAGQSVQWPVGMTYDEAWHEEDYPADIWFEAQSRWSTMTSAQQEDFRQYIIDTENAARELYEPLYTADITMSGFLQSFSLFDGLWAFLAIASAFRIGASGSESRQETAAA